MSRGGNRGMTLHAKTMVPLPDPILHPESTGPLTSEIDSIH